MNLDIDALAGIAIASATAGAGLGKLGDMLWSRRNGHSARPPVPACIIDPQMLLETHRIVTAESDDGSKKVWNKPSVEQAIRTMAFQVSQQTSILEDIRAALRKALK